MKKIFFYLYIALGLLLITSCDFSDDVQDIKTDSGTADFTTFVALGNSLTAGYQDGALYRSGQENSYPAMIAQGMNLSYEFKQPLMADDLGGIPMILVSNKRILANTDAGLLPVVASGTGATTLANIYGEGPFYNLGVPGAKVAHLLAPGYGNPLGLVASPRSANPYYVRFASSTSSTVIADALALNPTFFSLWIGNNDVLGYALSGGDGSDPLTAGNLFSQYYGLLVQQLTANGAKGVVANIPYVTTIPFFNTVPNDALELDAATAAQLTGFFTAVQGIFTNVLMSQGVPAAQAQAVAAQYGITFTEGKNRFLIQTEVTAQNPLGFRQMSEEELLVLSIDQAAMKAEGYGSIALSQEVMVILGKLGAGQDITATEAQQILQAVNPIQDKDVLDVEELALIKNNTDSYNASIKSIAESNDLAFFDANAMMQKLATEGLRINGVNYSSSFVTGGVFSLDGVHPNQRGYAIIANAFIDAINTKYNATIPKVDPNHYTGVTFP